MKVGKSEGKSGISRADEAHVWVRGKDLARDLIGQEGFTSFFLLMLLGRPANADQIALTDACLVAIAEHGLTPSVQAARMTYDAGPDALQGAVAAGILGCGSVVLGSAEIAGRLIARGVERMRAEGVAAEAVAGNLVSEVRAAGEKLPGFGHPLHKPVDPRCERLLALAEERGTAGPHVALARALKRAADQAYGRPMVMNVSAAIPAVLLDVDFPLEAMKGIPILARTAGLIAHLHEEAHSPIGFHMSYHGGKAVAFDGPEPE